MARSGAPWPLQGRQHLVVAFGNVYLSTVDGACAFGGDGSALCTAPTGFEVAFIGAALLGGEQTLGVCLNGHRVG
ncbi:MAG: hypothetical protein ACXWQZ_13225 [Ktedonobacterales bacterium]